MKSGQYRPGNPHVHPVSRLGNGVSSGPPDHFAVQYLTDHYAFNTYLHRFGIRGDPFVRRDLPRDLDACTQKLPRAHRTPINNWRTLFTTEGPGSPERSIFGRAPLWSEGDAKVIPTQKLHSRHVRGPKVPRRNLTISYMIGYDMYDTDMICVHWHDR